MAIAMQAKLLRVLEEGEVERIGGDRPIHVNVRVVVATHRNLEEQVRQGSFRGRGDRRVGAIFVAGKCARAAKRGGTRSFDGAA